MPLLFHNLDKMSIPCIICAMLDNLASKLMSPSFLAKFFILWLIVTLLASAVSLSSGTNTAPAVATTPEAETVERVFLEEEQSDGKRRPLAAVEVLPERLLIESLDIDLNVVNPTTTDIAVLDAELMNGAVRYPTSGVLGENGKNIVIFGHSARIPTYRGMYRAFNDIEQLNEGETIALQGSGKEYVYRVSRVYKKDANTDEIALGANNNKLTLVTCDGFGKKSDRWIVEADFIGSYDL